MENLDKFKKDSQAFLDALGVSYEKEDKRKNKLLLWCLILISVLVVGIIVLAFTIMRMMPLKQTEPIIAVVDSATGIVEKVIHLENDSDPSAFKMWIQSTVNSVVNARYGYAYIGSGKSLEERYNNAAVFMDTNVKRDFFAEVAPDNPNSPFSRLGKNGTIEVDVSSINVTDDKRFQVNFRTRMKNQGAEQVYSYSVVGSYVTGNYDDLSVEQQRLNAFGFKITGWSVSQNASTDALSSSSAVGLPEQAAVMPNVSETTEETKK